MNFQSRMTASWCDISGMVMSLCDMAGSAIIFYHNLESNRPHYHIYLFETNRKEDTIRNTIKKYNWPTKEDWCLRNYAGGKKDKVPITIAGACKYGSKGQYDPFYVKNIEEQTIKLGKTLGYCKKSESPAESVKVNLIKKFTNWDLVGLINDQVETHPSYDEKKTYGYMWYLERIAEVLERERQPKGMFKAIELFEMWKMRYQRSTWLREAADILERRYRPIN